MEMLPADGSEYVESYLVDIGALPLAAIQRWRAPAILAAMNGAVSRADTYHVYEQSSCPN